MNLLLSAEDKSPLISVTTALGLLSSALVTVTVVYVSSAYSSSSAIMLTYGLAFSVEVPPEGSNVRVGPALSISTTLDAFA